ncbi:MAG: hypothetical protein MHM6MM_000180 [Cercozoa sp. M6MM]
MYLDEQSDVVGSLTGYSPSPHHSTAVREQQTFTNFHLRAALSSRHLLEQQRRYDEMQDQLRQPKPSSAQLQSSTPSPRSPKTRPGKTPEKRRRHCFHCDKKFTFLRRKHVCQRCYSECCAMCVGKLNKQVRANLPPMSEMLPKSTASEETDASADESFFCSQCISVSLRHSIDLTVTRISREGEFNDCDDCSYRDSQLMAQRGVRWCDLLGLAQFKIRFSPKLFQFLVAQSLAARDVRNIQKDLQRTFPKHVFFADAENRESLRRVVSAYLCFTRSEYCQGMLFIVGVLRLHMCEEDAFFCFVQIMQGRLQWHVMFASNSSVLSDCCSLLDRLAGEVIPPVAAHLEKHEISAIMYASQWFVTVFCYKQPLHFCLSVFEIFLHLGVSALFRTALALLEIHAPRLLRSNDGREATMETALPL